MWFLGIIILPVAVVEGVFLYVIGATGEEILVGYGPLGVFVVALGAFAKSTIDRLIQDRNSAITQRDEMIKDLFTKAFPVMERTVDVLDKRQMIDAEIISVLKDVRAHLERR